LLQLEGWSDGAEEQQPAFGSVMWSDEVLERPALQPSKKVVSSRWIIGQGVVL
jgi:hypothetical protein